MNFFYLFIISILINTSCRAQDLSFEKIVGKWKLERTENLGIDFDARDTLKVLTANFSYYQQLINKSLNSGDSTYVQEMVNQFMYDMGQTTLVINTDSTFVYKLDNEELEKGKISFDSKTKAILENHYSSSGLHVNILSIISLTDNSMYLMQKDTTSKSNITFSYKRV
jgi:hypothetical protein